jgi:dTDP-4-dehydrorhamnose 3,5-epimerase-like enzyme
MARASGLPLSLSSSSMMMMMIPQVAADDYTVTITKVQLTYWCQQYRRPFSFPFFLFVCVV